MRPLAVYIHIPFCVRKCAYCDFLSFPPDALPAGAEESQRRYFDALLSEIRRCADINKDPFFDKEAESGRKPVVTSVYLGGGTPSLARPEDIGAVLEQLRECYTFADDAEISMECNPKTASADKLRAFRSAGVNRLSIGVQSFDDAELKILGRIHTAKEAEECYRDARAAGFGNINLDLMAALPGQTRESLLRSVRHAAGLSPEHLSLYSLIIEEGTPFYNLYGDQVPDPHHDRSCRDAQARFSGDSPRLPGEEEERDMLHAAWDMLAEGGYDRYEISNFARSPGYRCRQNLAYWQRGEYIGFGLGAASLINETRFANTRDLRQYISAAADEEETPVSGTGIIREDPERLDVSSRMEEFMFLGLRLAEGVSAERFGDTFHRSLEEVYGGVIAKLIAENLLTQENGYVRLTPYGTDIANYVMAQFLV